MKHNAALPPARHDIDLEQPSGEVDSADERLFECPV
jgi:hypothetical protein